jgi:hypothetical protein
MKTIVLRYGLRAGAILSALMLVSLPLQDRIGLDHSMLLGYATMVASFLLVFAAVRAHRDAAPGGTIGFGRALAVGTLVVLVASACYTATWEVAYFGFYRGTFLESYQAHTLKELRADGATPAQLAAKEAELRKFAEWYDQPAANAAMTFLEPLPPGLVMALAAAGLLRRRRAAPGTTEPGATEPALAG